MDICKVEMSLVKPFPEPMLTTHQWGSVAITLKQIYSDSENSYLVQ